MFHGMVRMMQKVKGTQDFLNNDLYEYIVETANAHCKQYHFTSIQTPIIEPTELFARAIGTATDVVGKEMFLIQPKEGSDSSICLRPEMTASTVRAFLEQGITTIPWNVVSAGPVFRYERPQKGRFRQFHQYNLEMIGASSIAYDAELISCLDQLFCHVFGLAQYSLMLNFLGCSNDRIAYKERLLTFLDTHSNEICATCTTRSTTNTLRVFDCKHETCQSIYQQAPTLIKHLCEQCAYEWEELQRLLQLLSVSFSVNPQLVRGLDYYNKTAFEFASTALGAQNSFCGGGRYDGLITQFEPKKSIPALGAAFGIERLMLMLELQQRTFAKNPLHVIIPFEPAQQTIALLLAQHLRNHKLTVQLLCDGSIKHRMKQADAFGAQTVLLLGSDEQAAGTVTVKTMATGNSKTIPQIEIATYVATQI